MKYRKIMKIITIYIALTILTPNNLWSIRVSSQANFTEEDNYFKIFSGNYFNVIIPKNNGLKIDFENNYLNNIFISFNFISEYNSPIQYLNSLNHLTGKGYKLDAFKWEAFGFSDANRTYVNLTRDSLDRKASFDFSTIVIANNATLNGYNIKALETAYLEMSISNWTFSEDVNGLALNILTGLDESNQYKRLGPFADTNNNQYVVMIKGSTYVFEIRCNNFIRIMTTNGNIEYYFSMFYANYNIAAEVNEPADFWLSIPYRQDIKKIIFSFICSFHPLKTDATTLFPYTVLLLSFIFLTYPLYQERRKQRGDKI